MPNFISYDPIELKYVIAPTRPATDIGKFNVEGSLTDTKLETSFKFTVIIFNDPPYFKQPLVGSVTVSVGYNQTYILPQAEDREGQPFKITYNVKTAANGPLPSFIKFSEANK